MNEFYWIVILAMALIVINELSYIGETSLAIVIITMAVSIGILAFGNVKK